MTEDWEGDPGQIWDAIVWPQPPEVTKSVSGTGENFALLKGNESQGQMLQIKIQNVLFILSSYHPFPVLKFAYDRVAEKLQQREKRQQSFSIINRFACLSVFKSFCKLLQLRTYIILY